MSKKNPKKVLVFGTFDLLHPGHRYFLKQAKKRGDYLVVVVARDQNVKKLKGKLPQDNEKARVKNVKDLDFVDAVYLGYRDLRKREKWIKKIKPAIICLGYDQQTTFRSKCFKIEKLKPFYPKKYKTSLLK